jgi:hypothetical protein
VLTEIIDQDFENIPVGQEEKTTVKKGKKPIFIFAGIFGGLLVLLLAAAIFLSFQQGQPTTEIETKPTPTPTPEFKEEIIPPSPYATDAAILKMEEEIKSLDQEIISTDLKESGLNPPVLEMKIQFET